MASKKRFMRIASPTSVTCTSSKQKSLYCLAMSSEVLKSGSSVFFVKFTWFILWICSTKLV